MTENPTPRIAGDEKVAPKRRKICLNPVTLYKMRKRAQAMKKHGNEMMKKREELFKNFKTLGSLVEMLNKQLPNRKARKRYWQEFIVNGAVQKALFENLVNVYKPNDDTYWVERNSLKLDKTKLTEELKKIETDSLDVNTIVDALSKIKISNIVEKSNVRKR